MTPLAGQDTEGPVFDCPAVAVVTVIELPLSAIVVRPVYTYPPDCARVSSAEFVVGGVSDGAVVLSALALLLTVYVAEPVLPQVLYTPGASTGSL